MVLLNLLQRRSFGEGGEDSQNTRLRAGGSQHSDRGQKRDTVGVGVAHVGVVIGLP